MHRRRFLAGGAAAFSALAGGCTGLDGGGQVGVLLTHVELGNVTDEARTFDVLVIRDEEIVRWTQHELPAGDGTVLEIDSSEEYAPVEVLVRVDGEWARTDFDSEEYDGKRVVAVAIYGMGEEALRISRVVSDRQTSTTE